jgi:glutathione synthase/RimK-type ligase-like ATP-grasp enzyme
MRARLVLVGVPGDKRTLALAAAAQRAGRELVEVPWSLALAQPEAIRRVAREGDVVRVESPGADAAIWHALARLGGEQRTFASGEWRPGRAWFVGLTRFFAQLDAQLRGLHVTHPCAQVLALTDKLVCQQRLEQAGVPVPAALPAPTTADELRATMRRLGRSAVFVKPRWGSSGAGVLAYRHALDRELLISTARCASGRIFNHKQLCRHETRASIDELLDAVLRDGALVQRWLPKAGLAAGPLDLRVLVIRGEVAQAVARVGRGTITNLHLNAARVDVETALARFGASAWRSVQHVARAAAACFPGQHCVGVDVMVDTRGNPFVLECNAWGDYLPRLLLDGLDSYDLYLRGLAAPCARSLEASP